ncbi:MAG TPA: hypothetical protein VJO33_05110 [Gemmatimonadaceae bacterium]|nr:hypothetical protein [Gemmatimonadaceae bacterium]
MTKRVAYTATSYSPDHGRETQGYAERKQRPVADGFIAVRSTARRAQIHVVRANGFMDVAKEVARRGAIATLCEMSATSEWTLIPRSPDHGYLVSCHRCRYRMHEEE